VLGDRKGLRPALHRASAGSLGHSRGDLLSVEMLIFSAAWPQVKYGLPVPSTAVWRSRVCGLVSAENSDLLSLSIQSSFCPSFWVHPYSIHPRPVDKTVGTFLVQNLGLDGHRVILNPGTLSQGVGRGQLVAQSGTSTWAPQFSSPEAGPVYFYPSLSLWQYQAAPSLQSLGDLPIVLGGPGFAC
jgi:hypothetical protein